MMGKAEDSWFRSDSVVNVLVGAGVSAAAPSSLPGWWTLNSEVIGALAWRLDEITKDPRRSEQFVDAIMCRRKETSFFSPDLQAQLLEDELGEAYFQALSVVDAEQPNASHLVLAHHAQAGRIQTLMTTNFDTLLERSLEQIGVPFTSYSCPDEFEQLPDEPSSLVLLKVHGTANRPDTMVDTLRQRIQGRPPHLRRWLESRFRSAPTLTLGFSGDDLGYRSDYLGIEPAI